MGCRLPRWIGCALAMLSWALPARAQGGVAGIVVDPQDRRVVHASVSLTCDGRTRRISTDGEGRFAFRLDAAVERCSLRVDSPGFSTAVVPVDAAGGTPRVVRLALQPVAETVEVRAMTAPGASGGIVMTGDQARAISDDPNEVLRVAKARAGPAAGHVIYVDGLLTRQLPPVGRIASVAVNTDPYSVEYSDPGRQRIDITTLAPDRAWRIDLGGAPPTFSSTNLLGEGGTARSLHAGLAGPAPWPGGAFAFHAALDALDGERAIVATAPGDASVNGQVAPSATSSRRLSFQLHQSLTAAGALRIEGSRTADRIANAGVGGEVLPEAGHALDGTFTDLRVTVNHDWRSVSWRSQFLGNWSTRVARATSTAVGIQVPGAFVGGGAALSWASTGQSQLLWKSTVAAPGGRVPWRAGFTLGRAYQQSQQVPNAAGTIQLDSPDQWRAATNGAAVGTAFRFAGATVQQVALLDAAAFADATIVHRAPVTVTAGMRVDWQRRERARLSPRLSATGRLGAWTLRSGIGLFTQAWRPEALIGTRAAEGIAPIQVMELRASTDGAAAGGPIVMDVAPGLTGARYLMTSQAVERSIGRFTVGIEHVWWRGRHLLGAERLADPISGGWTDWLESNRRFDSRDVRARLEVGGLTRSLSVTYAWMHSTDDTDGPWSFPARQGDLAAEEARSARVPAHNLDLVASASLPRSVRLTAMASMRGESPFNIVSGRDAETNGLYTDRAGLPRNSGRVPGSRQVALTLSRRFNLATLFGPRADLPIDGGIQIDNVLGGQVWTLVGNVAGSPLFGRPEGAMPGRSVRVWFALAR